MKKTLALLLLLGCATPRIDPKVEQILSPYAPVELKPPHPEQIAAFDRLAEDYWQWHLSESPILATRRGDDRYNDRLHATGADARKARRRAISGFGARLVKIDLGSLTPQRRISHRVLEIELAFSGERLKQRLWHFGVNHMNGPQVWLASMVDVHPLRSSKDTLDLIKRFKAFPTWMKHHIEDLREGVREERTAPASSVKRVIEQVTALLDTAAEQSPFVAPARRRMPESISETVRSAFVDQLLRTVHKHVYPAFRSYLKFLKSYPGRSRPGLGSVPEGPDAYESLIRRYTTLPLTADELHAIGIEELASIEREMEQLAPRMGFAGKGSELTRWILSDPRNFAETREELIRGFKEGMNRATAALPRFFSRLPELECEVRPIEAYRERDAVAAYYRRGSAVTGRPGVFFVNTFDPGSRPRFNMIALGAHESVPGHHLQLAIADELEALPTFRRAGGSTAFIEGWALYSERLAAEMGLYRTDLERFGMLTYQAWRAVRLIVDTGIHSKGWSRDLAIQFMKEHLALSELEITNEVDRYIIRPGQALAYKVGQREIEAIRHAAEKELGEAFEIREFHDRLLENGGLPLPVLREVMRSWIDFKKPID